MPMPFVALTTTIDTAGGEYRKPRVAIYAAYLAALQRVGLVPVLVTPAHSPDAIQALIDSCAGLVLSGGDDIDPARYGQDPIPELGPVNPARDTAEFRALEVALEQDLPVLGICRGHQLLNVFFGGTLCQDLDVAAAAGAAHTQTTPWGSHHHFVSIEPSSHVGRAIGVDRMEINSYHHQAINRVGRDLVVTARSHDGMIEAVESREHDWVVGVQWHPERYEADTPETDPNVQVFTAFAEAVRRRR